MHRPFSVTLLTAGVLIFMALYWARLVESIRQWDFLITLPLSISPLYLALSGLAAGLAGMPVVAGLWAGKRWGPRATWLYGLGLAGLAWVERLVLRTGGNENGLFALFLTLALIGWMAWALARSRTYFDHP